MSTVISFNIRRATGYSDAQAQVRLKSAKQVGHEESVSLEQFVVYGREFPKCNEAFIYKGEADIRVQALMAVLNSFQDIPPTKEERECIEEHKERLNQLFDKFKERTLVW